MRKLEFISGVHCIRFEKKTLGETYTFLPEFTSTRKRNGMLPKQCFKTYIARPTVSCTGAHSRDILVEVSKQEKISKTLRNKKVNQDSKLIIPKCLVNIRIQYVKQSLSIKFG